MVFTVWIEHMYNKSVEEIFRQEMFLYKTKCKSIITGVYIPRALEELKNNLKCVTFVVWFLVVLLIISTRSTFQF
jgi:hypothetical protein